MQKFIFYQYPIRLFAFLLLATILAACATSSEPKETPIVAPPTVVIEAAVDTPTAAISPTELPTELPTETAVSTAIPTTRPPTAEPPTIEPATAEPPTPEPPTPKPPTLPTATILLPNTPWWVFTDGETIWGVNADGSGLTTLFDQIGAGEAAYVHLRGAPAGGRLAFIDHGATFYEALTLTEIILPAGNTTALTTLAPAYFVQSDPPPPPASLTALMEVDNLAWSPDGATLAYMGIEGEASSDLFIYDTGEATMTQLTDGPSQGILPIWSPDGRYILHMGVSSLGTGAGWGLDGIWAAAADNSGVVSFDIPEISAEERVLGWIGNDTYLIQSGDIDCGMWRDLRAVSLIDQTELLLWSGYFSHAAHDPVSGNVVVTLNQAKAECNTYPTIDEPSSIQAGIFLIQPDGQINPLASNPDIEVGSVRWDVAVGSFFASIDNQLVAISLTGEITNLPDPHAGLPIAAPDGKTLAWVGYATGLWISSIESTPQQIFSDRVVEVTWSPDGQTILFLASGTLYAASAPDFIPVILGEPGFTQTLHAVWVMP